MTKVTRLPTAKRRPVKNPVALDESPSVAFIETASRLDVPAERVLHQAAKANLANAVVIGWDAEGDFYFAGSYSAMPEVLWLLALAQKRLLDLSEGD